MKEGAIRRYQLADSVESQMVYDEPRDWLLNPKWYLGNAYLANKAYKDAEKIFNRDLQYNRDNFFSLRGLYDGLLLQQKKAAAAKIKVRIMKIYPGALQ